MLYEFLVLDRMIPAFLADGVHYMLYIILGLSLKILKRLSSPSLIIKIIVEPPNISLSIPPSE